MKKCKTFGDFTILRSDADAEVVDETLERPFKGFSLKTKEPNSPDRSSSFDSIASPRGSLADAAPNAAVYFHGEHGGNVANRSGTTNTNLINSANDDDGSDGDEALSLFYIS